MDSPIAQLFQPQKADDTPASAEAYPSAEPGKIASPIAGLFQPPTDRRSAEEVIQRGQFADRDWADTQKQLQAEGYRPTPEMGKQYDQQTALKAEKIKQGRGVGMWDQAARNIIPVGSSIINNRRESAYFDATKNLQAGKASADDLTTIAAHERRVEADRTINSTLTGRLLNIPLQAPAVIGEALGAGKVLGLGAKAVGIGQAARAPLLAAQNPGVGKAFMNFAGKQALSTPLMPSLYLEKAAQKNIEEGRDPNDVRGFAPALALAYSQNLVLGSLQKYRSGGNLVQQATKKGTIGAVEQAVADVGAGAIDEFLPKAYKMDTRYGALGDIARGDVSQGLGRAAMQALTFSYFSAIHGKDPAKITDATKEYLDASHKAGAGPDRAAAPIDKVMNDLRQHLNESMADAATDNFRAEKQFTQDDARAFLDAKYVEAMTKNMHPDQAEAFKKFTDSLIEGYDTKAEADAKDAATKEAMAKKKKPLMLEGGKPELEAQAPEPTPEKTVRLYHGGVDTPAGEPRWVSPDPEYAAGWARKSHGDVHFVDVPESHPIVQGMLHEAENSTGQRNIRYGGNIELPGEFGEKFKKLEGWNKDTAPSETKPVDHVATLSAEDRAAVAKALGYNESGFTKALKDPKMAKSINDFIEKAMGAGESETAVPPKPSGRALSLSEGKAAGKDHHGAALTRHDITDQSGKKVGEIKLQQRGETVHVHWLEKTGLAGGEGRGKEGHPFGAKELLLAAPDLASKYPTARYVQWTPSAGRIKAGEQKVIDLNKIRDRRQAQAEGHPARRAGEANHVAPDLHPEVAKSAHEAAGEDGVKAATELHEAATAPEVTEAHVAEAEKAAAESIKEVESARTKAVDDASRGTDRSGEPAVAAEPHGSEPGKLVAEAESSGVHRANQDADRTHAEAAAKPRKPRQAKGEGVKKEPKPVKKPTNAKSADPVARARDAVAAYSDVRSRAEPIFKKYNNLRDPEQRKALEGELTKFDDEAEAALREKKAALEALADQSGSEFAVHVVDGPGAAPREVSRHLSLDEANSRSRRIADQEMRGQVERMAGKDMKNEFGDKLDSDGRPHSAERHYGPNGKQVYVSRVDRAPKPAPESARKSPVKKPRIETVADAVRDAGGIKFDAGMKRFFTDQNHAIENNLNTSLFRKNGSSIEQLAKELKRHIGSEDPQDLINALMDNRPSRLADRTAADEHDLKEHLRQQAEGSTQGQWNATDEVPWNRGGQGGTESHRLVAEQNKLFGARNYVEKGVPGAPSDVNAAARLKERATVTRKLSAGDAEVNLEEHAHHLQKQYGLPTDPAALPGPVAKGIQAFFSYRAKHYGVSETTPSRTGMIEGFADWLIARSKNDLTGLSPTEEVANKYLEKWAADHNLTEKFDKLKELYKDFHGQTPEAKAAGLVSSTGQPEAPPKTIKEAAQDLANKAQESIDDSLSVLNRLGADAEANGAPKGLAKRVKTVWSQLMYADPHRAAEFERDGVHTIEDGRKKVIGLPFEKIVEGAKPEWLQPGENGGASRAGVYALARHLLGEEARGETNRVSKEQLEVYRSAFEEMGKDKEFSDWAKGFAERLTDANNASLDALAGEGVKYYSKDQVDAMKKKYPDYAELSRVMQDAGWKTGGGARGAGPKTMTGERSGSGEQIVDPLISYKNRLRATSAVMGEQLRFLETRKFAPYVGDWMLSSGVEQRTKLGDLRAEVLEKLGFKGTALESTLKAMGADRAEDYFRNAPWPVDGTKPTYTRMYDGKPENYRIGNRDFYNLITGQQTDASATASWMRATAGFLPIKWMTQAVKFGATSASLGFQFRNVPRDIYTFWANTIDRAKANPRDLGDAYKRAFAYSWHQLTAHFDGAPSQDALYKRFAADRGLDQRQFTFEKDNPASAYAKPSETKVIRDAHTVWGVLKDVLNLAGAGENAPRFLEWKTRLEQTTGLSEKELTGKLEEAEKAASEGRNVPDPIPFHQALDAMEHAAEVTVNFNRLGTVTREVNKITPFFGPAIAGLSKSVRNWKDNPKGAAFAMSGLLGARLLHWLLYSDEDWYKELNSNDRFNNFVVPTPAGLRRLPAPRDLEVAGGGLLITALDAAAKKNPDFKGLLKESLSAVAPPAPVPPVGKVGYEIARNENWMGSPIVPKRDENKRVEDKWTEDRLPYAADQLTGGLLSARKTPSETKDLIPYSEVKNARRSVDDFYERFHDLEEQRNKALKQGKRFEAQAEYHRLNAAQEAIVATGRAVRGDRMVNGRVVKGEPPTPEKIQELRAKQIQIARKALGSE